MLRTLAFACLLFAALLASPVRATLFGFDYTANIDIVTLIGSPPSGALPIRVGNVVRGQITYDTGLTDTSDNPRVGRYSYEDRISGAHALAFQVPGRPPEAVYTFSLIDVVNNEARDEDRFQVNSLLAKSLPGFPNPGDAGVASVVLFQLVNRDRFTDGPLSSDVLLSTLPRLSDWSNTGWFFDLRQGPSSDPVWAIRLDGHITSITALPASEPSDVSLVVLVAFILSVFVRKRAVR